MRSSIGSKSGRKKMSDEMARLAASINEKASLNPLGHIPNSKLSVKVVVESENGDIIAEQTFTLPEECIADLVMQALFNNNLLRGLIISKAQKNNFDILGWNEAKRELLVRLHEGAIN